MARTSTCGRASSPRQGKPSAGAGGPPVREPLTLGTLTDAAQDFSFVATSADHALFAWQDAGVRPADGSPPGVRGTSFLMVNAPMPHSDFSGDAVDDLLWRRSDGLVAEWQMSDGHIKIGGNTNLATVAASYQVQDFGDLNGDAFADVLWRHDSGQVVLWTMHGANIKQQQAIATIGLDWHNEGIGDFGGDGRADVLWRNDSGQASLWTMNGASIVNNQSVATISFDWHNQGLGDFNADGHSDVLWRHCSGQVVMWQMDGATIASNTAVANLGLDWDALGVGDFNGDGRSDVLLRHNSGQVVEWQMNGSRHRQQPDRGEHRCDLAPRRDWRAQRRWPLRRHLAQQLGPDGDLGNERHDHHGQSHGRHHLVRLYAAHAPVCDVNQTVGGHRAAEAVVIKTMIMRGGSLRRDRNDD